MKEYHTAIEIEAPVDEVWKVLTDFSKYPDWNPLVSSLEGEVREGGTISTTIVPLDNTYSARLLSFKPNQEIVWQGVRGAKFLLAGRHYYRLLK